MKYRLLIDLEVTEFTQQLPKRVRDKLFAHFRRIRENHYHLLLELDRTEPEPGGTVVKLQLQRRFNRRHGRSGYLFQGRFKSVAVSPEEWALSLSRYLHLNPSVLSVPSPKSPRRCSL